MGLLIVVVPIAVAIVVAALVAFRWAVKSGQLDDLETPAVRMLHDDEPVRSAGPEPSALDEERS
ncbi:MAG: cbb3-type cytochrome oxidase assembly protein CcoS [Planctomycetota bacterium]